MTKLTIGIPTFNGSKYIAEAIDSVLAQLDGLPEGYVQILVADNCSDEALRQAVAKYTDKFPGLVVCHRNAENLGFDGNLDAIFKKAAGDYVWLLSDDDVLYPGAIAAVRPFLERQVDYVHLNWSECRADLSVRNPRTLFFKQDFETMDFSAFLSKVKINPVFVSSNIFRRDRWPKSADLFRGGGWLHYARFLALAESSSKLAVIAAPQVKYRGGTGAWKKDNCWNIELGIRLIGIIRHYSKYFSKDAFLRCFDIAISEMHLQICAARLAQQEITPGLREKIGKAVDFGWRHKYFYRLLFVLPLPLVRLVNLFFRFTRKSSIFLGKHFTPERMR